MNDTEHNNDEPTTRRGLWASDTGTLGEQSRRALLELIKGPYLSGARSSALWSALLADEPAIRSRLHDIFLDLVVDRDNTFAFVRGVRTHEMAVPVAVRSERLTFLDTAMLLALRQSLLLGEGGGRVIVDRDEIFEKLTVYDTQRDEVEFAKRLGASWTKMVNKLRVIHSAGDDRAEISPVLALIVDVEQIVAIDAEYKRIAAEATRTATTAVPAASAQDEHS
jgi:hypothetical protein